VDIVEFDVLTGKKRTLPDTARRALEARVGARIPHALRATSTSS